MKNIILSIIVIAVIIGLGYYLFSNKKSDADSYLKTTSSGVTDNSTPMMEDGSQNTATPSAPDTYQIKKSHMITLDTNYGKIVIETYDGDAPNTVKNFVTLAGKGFYNGLSVHRVL